MWNVQDLDVDSSSLNPIPTEIRHWLTAVVVLAFLSFFASFSLFLVLSYRLFRWHSKAKRTNQFVILIFNLVLADIQQCMAFLLNAEWLRTNQIAVGTHICWVQGWFVSTGDLASGVWCLTIGIHTLASVIFNYRLKPLYFYSTITALWIFVYSMALIGVGLHPHGLYVRAGAWCWVNHEFGQIRLWTHYFWIFVAQFGVVVTYTLIYVMLVQRIRSGGFGEAEAARARTISNFMVVYPVIYVFCTVPLASARMAAMSGHPPSLRHLCLAAAMITSNGWMDVLLYTLTRRIEIFSDEPPPEDYGVDTFNTAFWGESHKRLRVTTTIEATARPGKGRGHMALHSRPSSRNGSTDDLVGVQKGIGLKDIMTVTTTEVRSDPAELADMVEMEEEARKQKPQTPDRRFSMDSVKSGQLERIPD
ncbi:integral membrane protein-like protein [Glonium stellatum]|uniref:Integral membrane protein-like protein n=1 Tax=Glonium stellatum TaxID=574774 RepID=A0A8E2JT97_9PEZI|nr:integral membrane protein-like protein [Glonium stellatum]